MIHLFALDTNALKDDDLFCRWYFELSSVRRERIDESPARSDKSRSLGAGILLDYGLKTVYGLREQDMEIQLGMFGKPVFANVPGIEFDLSHDGEKVMLALSDRPVGCDIDNGFPISLEEIRRRSLVHPIELRVLEGLETPGEVNDAFSRYWALKESFGKNTGIGVNVGVDAIWFDAEGETPCIHQNVFQGDWHFKTFRLLPHYHAAVCSEEDCSEVELTIVDESIYYE